MEPWQRYPCLKVSHDDSIFLSVYLNDHCLQSDMVHGKGCHCYSVCIAIVKDLDGLLLANS